MKAVIKTQLFSALMLLVGCSTLGIYGDGEGVFRSSAERLNNEAPDSMTLPPDDGRTVDDVHMQTKADYHFTMAENYSLQDNPTQAVENYKLALVYDPSSSQIRYRLALEYVKLGLVSEAIAQCKEAIEKDSSHKDAALLLGGLFSALQLYDQALVQYERVLKNHPDDLEASLFIGALYAEQGQFDKAINYLQRLSRKKSIEDKSQVWYYLGRIYASKTQPNFANAESAFVTSLKMNPESIESVLALGSVYEQQKKFKKAAKTYSNFQDQYGPHHAIADRLSQIYLNDNDLEKGLNQLLIVESYDSTNLNISLKIALLLIEQKKYPKAINKLEAILQRAPNSEKVRFYLGALYEETKNYRAAIQQFETVQYGSEYFEDSVMHAAYLYKILDNHDDAIKTVKKGLYHNDSNPKYWVLHASLLDEQDKLNESRDILKDAVKKFPENIQVHFQLGSVYDRLGQKDKTVEHMERVIQLDENHVQALNYLAYVFAEGTRNLATAEKLARKALKLQPGDGYIMDTLGWVLFKQDRIQEAVKILEKAHAKEGKESIIAEHLGDAYFRYKLHLKAKKMYRKAADLEKDNSNRAKIEGKINSINERIAAEKRGTGRQPATK